jgi:Rnl2 family RNA ligase
MEVFKPYSKVVTVPQTKPFQALRINDWVVQEKVLGTNFSLWVSREGIQGANRDRFLRENEDFFNWKSIRNTFAEGLRTIFRRIRARQLVIYGEIFGGVYPHARVAECPGAIKLNRGTYYAPHNDWYTFDVVIDGMFQDCDYMYQLFDELGVKYAFELTRGSLAKCLKFSEHFGTEIPDIYGFPQIEGNTAAGVIIRPVKPLFLSNGVRVLYKKEASKKWSLSAS